jgi:hypothetical protein
MLIEPSPGRLGGRLRDVLALPGRLHRVHWRGDGVPPDLRSLSGMNEITERGQLPAPGQPAPAWWASARVRPSTDPHRLARTSNFCEADSPLGGPGEPAVASERLLCAVGVTPAPALGDVTPIASWAGGR